MNNIPNRNSKVVIRSVNDLSLEQALGELAEACDFEKVIPRGARVVIKVNLSTPVSEMAYASNTSPELLDGVLGLLKERTDDILVGESNGMRYDTEDAFEVSGFYPIIERHGAKPVSFTKDTSWHFDTRDPRCSRRAWTRSPTAFPSLTRATGPPCSASWKTHGCPIRSSILMSWDAHCAWPTWRIWRRKTKALI